MPTSHRPTAITLPRNFTYIYNDNSNGPQTPAPGIGASVEAMPPPAMPRPGFRVRRRNRVDRPEAVAIYQKDTSQVALPTIEMTEASASDTSSPVRGPPDESIHHLAPHGKAVIALPPPRTPSAQTLTYEGKCFSEWSLINRDLPIRPTSACSNSNFSESSFSSMGSSTYSYPSLHGSCTSPESEAADPFFKTSTDAPAHISHSNSRRPRRNDMRWTADMDDHLWLTFMAYVQDPRVTPFKMLPGIVPPLGVCHRVAREAKRTWREPGMECIMTSIEPLPFPRQRPSSQQRRPRWAGSEAATRRHLRDLCKNKPSLSAHYQRLIKARSPSPFTSSSSPGSDAPIEAPDLKPHTVDTTPASMPVVEPADAQSMDISDDTEPRDDEGVAGFTPQVMLPTQRMGRRTRAHHKSQSLQLELGLKIPPREQTGQDHHSVLASPFESGPNYKATQSLGRSFARKNASSMLQSPLELPPPMPVPRSLKRRFKVEDEQPTDLRKLFVRPDKAQQIPRPARDRAFSLSAVHRGIHEVAATSMPHDDVQMQDALSMDMRSATHLVAPTPALRLGSPFHGGPTPSFNTFPRRFVAPNTGSAFVATPNTNLENQFRELAAQSRREDV